VIEVVARAAENGGYTTQDARFRSLEEVLKGFVSVLLSVAIERRKHSLSTLDDEMRNVN